MIGQDLLYARRWDDGHEGGWLTGGPEPSAVAWKCP